MFAKIKEQEERRRQPDVTVIIIGSVHKGQSQKSNPLLGFAAKSFVGVGKENVQNFCWKTLY